jgi:hypothetical protein
MSDRQPKDQSTSADDPRFSQLRKALRDRIEPRQLKLDKLRDFRGQLTAFLESKWHDIKSSSRNIALDPDRTYSVDVRIRFLCDLGIKTFVFRPAELKPPAVGVDLIMIHQLPIPCLLSSSGRFADPSALLDLHKNNDFWLLLNLAVVMHYHDLVLSTHDSDSVAVRDTRRKKTLEPSGAGAGQTVARRLPRFKKVGSEVGGNSRNNESLYAARVDAFRRRLPRGHKPSFAKIVEADQFGIDLQGPDYPAVKYTFVRPHARGRDAADPKYRYLPSYKASRVLENILDAIGLY